MTTYNMNAEVMVRLTASGRRIWLTHHNFSDESFIKLAPDYIVKMSLWELMQMFGPHIHMGCEPPFEHNSISIEERAR